MTIHPARQDADRVRRDQLEETGYCIFPDVVGESLLARLIATTDRVVARYGPEHASRERTTGSMVPTTSDPVFAELITLPRALDALRGLGYPQPSFSDGWVISKPGGGPRLFWHHDWFAWEDPASYQRAPLQVSLMYYLNDTRRENGCLRVVPGSHNRHNPLHDLLSRPRAELTAGEAPESAEFSDRPDEVDVEIKAGDLLITDARLLHAAHANKTEERRRLVTLWYQPELTALPERIQAQMASKAQPIPPDWPKTAQAALTPIRTRYAGRAQPYEVSAYRGRQP